MLYYSYEILSVALLNYITGTPAFYGEVGDFADAATI